MKEPIQSSYELVCPEILKQDIVSIDVSYIDFDGKEQNGIIEVHKTIKKDIVHVFKKMKQISFPLHTVKPIHLFHGNDDVSMEENNTYAFCFRTVTLKPHEISNHSYGVAIDINPVQNPYINQGQIFPPKAIYETKNKGTLHREHPIVIFLKERGFTWGGDWDKSYQDYQHFHKELPNEYMQKYQSVIKEVLENIQG